MLIAQRYLKRDTNMKGFNSWVLRDCGKKQEFNFDPTRKIKDFGATFLPRFPLRFSYIHNISTCVLRFSSKFRRQILMYQFLISDSIRNCPCFYSSEDSVLIITVGSSEISGAAMSSSSSLSVATSSTPPAETSPPDGFCIELAVGSW